MTNTPDLSVQCNLTVRPRERQEPPRFVEKLTTLKTEEGEGVSFGVRAVGDPTPNLTWLKDGRELPLAGRAEHWKFAHLLPFFERSTKLQQSSYWN